uniref:Uncharacterized protein n=1 Tax=Anguilla anguilla TaxID=7936 RepID=A0A0E9TPQ4_ANGAN
MFTFTGLGAASIFKKSLQIKKCVGVGEV